MAGRTRWQLLVASAILLALKMKEAESSADVMKKMTVEFTKGLDECKQEVNIGDHIKQDMKNFWKEDYALLNTDLGCAIMCMASKLNLVVDSKLHHGNALTFAMEHGANDNLARDIMKIIKDCEDKYEGVDDDCSRILEIAKCFKAEIHILKWAPDIELILEEIMTTL